MLNGREKILVGENPPKSWPWKQNGTTVVAAVKIPEVVNNWRSVLQINHLKKKLDLEPESSSVTGIVCYLTILECVVSTWSIMFDRNSGEKTSQIEWLFESNLRSFGYFKACVSYFLSNFYFSPNDSPSKIMKNLFYFI